MTLRRSLALVLACSHGTGSLLIPQRAPALQRRVHTFPVGRCGRPLLREAAEEERGAPEQLETSLLLRGGEAAAESPLARLRGFLDRRFFLVGVVAAVALAALVPELGRKGGPLLPELTVNWGAPCGIFLLSGLTLPSSQLAATAVRVKEHALIQAFNLAYIPLVMLAVCTGLGGAGVLPKALADGLLVMAAVPTTVNMCVALSRSAGANEALAIFNAVVGNVLGVVLTPWLVVRLVGAHGTIAAADVLKKLTQKVVLPLVAGQLLRRLPSAAGLIKERKKLLSRASESLLLLTVFTTFCDTFLQGTVLAPATVAALLGLVVATHLFFLASAWVASGWACGQGAMSDRVAILYASTQKTLALGLPLLRILFQGRADLAVLCTPLLMQHPLQLIVGSLLQPVLARKVAEAEQGNKAA